MQKKEKALMVFYNSKKEILLQDRRNMPSKFGLEWGFFGGGIELGESPEQAVRREIEEELTYQLGRISFLGLFTDRVKDWMVERHVFLAPLEDTSPLVQKEGAGMRWFSLPEALQLKMYGPGDREVLEKLQTIL